MSLVMNGVRPRAQSEWALGKTAKAPDPKLDVVVRVLAAGLLLGWEEIHAKHPNHRSETAGQKCARRDEQLLQLLLRMHILAAMTHPSGALTGSCLRPSMHVRPLLGDSGH